MHRHTETPLQIDETIIYSAVFQQLEKCQKSVIPKQKGVSAYSPYRFVLNTSEEEEEMQDLSFSSSSHPPFQPFHNPAHCIHQSQALTRNIPHSHGLVQTRRHNQVFRWVELGAHHIVIMASQNTGCQKKKRIY